MCNRFKTVARKRRKMLITAKRYQEAIRDRLIIEMIKKILAEEKSYILADMATALLDASDECRRFEADLESCLTLVDRANKASED